MTHDPRSLTHRQYLNPLRQLTLARVVQWLEASERGIVASLQYLYRFIERRDATLFAIVERRLAAIDNLSWEIKVREDIVREDDELKKEVRKKRDAEKKAKKEAEQQLLKGQELQNASAPGQSEEDQGEEVEAKKEGEGEADAEGDDEELPDSPRMTAAKAQKATLEAAYQSIPNLRQALRHLALATFRGYAHLEKHRSTDGEVIRLEPVPQWNLCRAQHERIWRYNRDAWDTNMGEDIKPEDWIIREVDRPIDEIGVVCFMRKNLGHKDWDGFIETFGLPPVFIELPEGTTATDQIAFQNLCEQIIADGRGTLPAGAKVVTLNAAERGKNPFLEHIEYQDSQIVLAGTGGKLTMLNDPTGLGSGQSEVHADTFQALGAAEGKDISEVLQEQMDAEVLQREHPGEETMAYFQLSPVEVIDAGEVVLHSVQLKNAGWKIRREQLEEKTGYELEEQEQPPKLPPFAPGAPKPPAFLKQRAMTNRANPMKGLAKRMTEATTELRKRLVEAVDTEDPALRKAKLLRLRAELPSYLKRMGAKRDTQAMLEKAFAEAMEEGKQLAKKG